MIDSEKMLRSIFRIEKRLSKKWRGKFVRNEQDLIILKEDTEFVANLEQVVWALYEVETGYKFLKAKKTKAPTEAEDALFDCISKLYSCLGNLLKNEK